jgi:hypothetical protein
MNKKSKLIILKIIHTILWIILIYFIGYIWYAGIFNKKNKLLGFSIALVVGEGVVLLTNGGKCPLTIMAKRIANKNESVFDIYLPKWIAKYNIPVFTIISIIGIILVIIRVIARR